MRGYSCIGLQNPKTPANVGHIMRAAGCYGVSSVFFTGNRYTKAKQFITDPQKNYRHIPLVNVDDLQPVIPYDCVPVAIEFFKDAESLIDYKHPERAFYVFGPEDGTLGEKTLGWCRDIICIPSNFCMNLSATVNVVLYDRLAKEK
jgi:tRNA(Leu) C34 or U34 (ribose-2'-O)-methylase TrmL